MSEPHAEALDGRQPRRRNASIHDLVHNGANAPNGRKPHLAGERRRVPAFLEVTDDFLAGLGAARRSPHTLAGYRNDVLGVGRRIAAKLHGVPNYPDPALIDASIDHNFNPNLNINPTSPSIPAGGREVRSGQPGLVGPG